MQPDTYIVVTHDDGCRFAFGNTDGRLSMTSEFDSDQTPRWQNAQTVVGHPTFQSASVRDLTAALPHLNGETGFGIEDVLETVLKSSLASAKAVTRILAGDHTG